MSIAQNNRVARLAEEVERLRAEHGRLADEVSEAKEVILTLVRQVAELTPEPRGGTLTVARKQRG